MKYFILIIAVSLSACQPSGREKQTPVVVRDTVTLPGRVVELPSRVVMVHDTIVIPDTSCNAVRRELIVANFKLARIDYYLQICLNNSSQDKFLKGWVKRALN